MKSRCVVSVAALTVAIASTGWAAYQIDGDLSDWGVKPFYDWVPDSPTAYYHETNNSNEYHTPTGGSECDDFEAAYFDSDAYYFYMAIVTSRELGSQSTAGDIGFSDGVYSISPHGIVTGLNYAIKVRQWSEYSPTVKNKNIEVWKDPVWVPTSYVEMLAFTEWYQQGSPYYAESGTLVGTAFAEIARFEMEPGADAAFDLQTTILELKVSRSLFPELDYGDVVLCHITMHCGNDSINLVANVVPLPGTALLYVTGAALAGLRRRTRDI